LFRTERKFNEVMLNAKDALDSLALARGVPVDDTVKIIRTSGWSLDHCGAARAAGLRAASLSGR
jgi:hypothetical protein